MDKEFLPAEPPSNVPWHSESGAGNAGLHVRAHLLLWAVGNYSQQSGSEEQKG